MFLRFLAGLLVLSLFCIIHPDSTWAESPHPPVTAQQDENSSASGFAPPSGKEDSGDFAKPYEFERQAYGYDPEGIDYKENQAEDFQVVFVSSIPFAGAASYGLTGLTSLIFQDKFAVEGDYFVPFLAGTFVGAMTIASISVLSNPYPPPSPRAIFSQAAPPLPTLAFKIDVLTARF